MADAVLRERLLVGGAALALLFLTVLVLAGLFVLIAHLVDRYRQADAQVERILADTRPKPGPTPAVLDTEPGINLADQDACELIWDMTPRDPGPERLKAAIRREQQKGDTA